MNPQHWLLRYSTCYQASSLIINPLPWSTDSYLQVKSVSNWRACPEFHVMYPSRSTCHTVPCQKSCWCLYRQCLPHYSQPFAGCMESRKVNLPVLTLPVFTLWGLAFTTVSQWRSIFMMLWYWIVRKKSEKS